MPHNKKTGLEYQGRNISHLLSSGFKSLEWATFLQWRELGYKVNKGAKCTRIQTFIPTTKRVNDRVVESTAVRVYALFNSEQVEKI